MRLTKFPVTYEDKEYFVSVVDNSGTIPNITVYLYKKQTRKPTFWSRKDYKYICLFENISGWNRYSEFKGKYIELVQETVEKYHQKIKNGVDAKLQLENGLAEWNVWDGKIH